MAGWENPLNLLHEEMIQRRDEGAMIPPGLGQRIAVLDPGKDAWDLSRIDPLYDELMALTADAELASREPDDLKAIRALRPDGPRDLRWRPSDPELLDRMHGAWTGRATGCALGKPVEGLGMWSGRNAIKSHLQALGEWPLRDFFSGRDAGDGVKLECRLSQRENIAFMEPDDDIHYSLVALGVLEEHGTGFQWDDVARYWQGHIPVSYICTAERQALLNYQNRSSAAGGASVSSAYTRMNRNPYREWIGAQIRSDGWGWACAGRPELAAELAFRDASWTHTRNGVYGEMMFAAMQAAAFVEHDPRRLVEIGLSEIPRDCRLARLIRECLAWVEECPDWDSCMEKVDAACARISPVHLGSGVEKSGMSPVHTYNNAAICVLSLFYGGMDTMDAILTSVMCGLDTDCNGATVGSIVGAATGRAAFKNGLAGRLNDMIQPAMIGFEKTSMRDLAGRGVKVWKKIRG